MKVNRLMMIVICLVTMTSGIEAQVEAPGLLCIRNDSLFWNLPAVTCGPVLSYQIWVSQNVDGPFSQLEEISDITQSSYFADNPGNLTRYFYMTTSADCPGEPSLSSDTLDNRPPMSISIDYVSVEDENVEIHWTNLSEQDIEGYIVYKVTDLGTVPVDTLLSGPYTDLNADAGLQSEFYYVNALDACGNTSFFDDPHHTILLDYQIDICDQSAMLNWNAYENWSNAVEKHNIYLSKNGRPFEWIGESTANATAFKVPGLKRDTLYNIKISAVESITGYESFSNDIAFDPNVTEGVTPFVLYNADINPNGSVVLEWYWSGDVNTDSVFMNVFDLTAGNELIKLQKVTGLNPSAEFQSYSVEGLIPETNQYAFNLVAFNTCNKESQSNSLTTIFLRGSFDSNTATLNWNQNNSNVNLQNLLINRDGTFEKLITLSAERQTHNHVWPDSDASNCYIVSDSGQVMSPQGVLRSFVQRSNVTCIFRALRIYIPTAFAPSGVNRLFIPYFSSTSLLKQYQLDIYDRWGGKIFSSDNYLLGWNGYTKDKLLPSDLYTYVLEIVTIADEKVLRKGEVFLVR